MRIRLSLVQLRCRPASEPHRSIPAAPEGPEPPRMTCPQSLLRPRPSTSLKSFPSMLRILNLSLLLLSKPKRGLWRGKYSVRAADDLSCDSTMSSSTPGQLYRWSFRASPSGGPTLMSLAISQHPRTSSWDRILGDLSTVWAFFAKSH